MTPARLLAVLAAFGSILSATAADPKPIAVDVGEEFEIVLEAPGGANQRWLLSKPLDEEKLKESRRQYRRVAREHSSAQVCEVLRYKAIAEGTTRIHLKYASLFEPQTGVARNTNFVVIIKGTSGKPPNRSSLQ